MAWRRLRGPSGQPAAWQRRRRTQTDRKRKANSRRLERTQEGAKKTEIHAHATPSPLLRTASRYKQISLHDAPAALPLRCSPGWFLLSALLLSTRLSCSWRLMDAGRAPTLSSDAGLALLFFYICSYKMKNPAAEGGIMERGVLGSWGAGAVQILGTKTGAAT